MSHLSYASISNFEEEMNIELEDQPLITSRRNPLVKRLKALATSKGRKDQSMLLLEGTHLLQEVLRTSFLPKEIVATRPWITANQDILQIISNKISLHVVTQEVLESALSTVHPDGVASVLPINALPQEKKSAEFVLALDRLQDPGNLGTLLRTALAAEIDSVWLASGADPLSPKVLRASSGAILHLPFNRFGATDLDALKKLAEQLRFASSRGLQIVASIVPSSTSLNSVFPYWELDWRKPTVLVLGNEGSGLHPILQACCTHAVTLPHSSSVESLNVASAAVPLLLERRRATMTT